MLTPETKGQTASRVEGNRQKITANEKIPLARLTQYRNCGLLTHNLFGGSRRSSCVRADSWREQERKMVASPIVSHKQLSFLGHRLVAGVMSVRELCRERRYAGKVYFSTRHRLEYPSGVKC